MLSLHKPFMLFMNMCYRCVRTQLIYVTKYDKEKNLPADLRLTYTFHMNKCKNDVHQLSMELASFCQNLIS